VTLSLGGKLPPGQARDLREYTKLLGEMKKAIAAIEAQASEQAEADLADVDSIYLDKTVRSAKPTE